MSSSSDSLNNPIFRNALVVAGCVKRTKRNKKKATIENMQSSIGNSAIAVHDLLKGYEQGKDYDVGTMIRVMQLLNEAKHLIDVAFDLPCVSLQKESKPENQ